ncbi:S8 family serine peptidase, partial [Streptomyces sp. NPDC003691]
MRTHSRLRACAAAAAALIAAAALSAAGSAAAAPEPKPTAAKPAGNPKPAASKPAETSKPAASKPAVAKPAATSKPAAATRREPAPLRRTKAPIPGQYIVTLKKGVSPESAVEEAVPGLKPLFTYGAVLNGFAAKLTPAQLKAVRSLPAVEVVEQDGTASGGPITPRTGRAQAFSWGLDRIDQPYLPLNQEFNVSGTGVGATAYIIDSGIDYGHPEFGGRAVAGFDAFGGNGQDCNGHGTHVAGTVGGADFGVARQARLVSVRVLGCDNRGPWSGIIAGFDWVAQNARQPAVINASLGGDRNQAVNNAATNVSLRGILPVVGGGGGGGRARPRATPPPPPTRPRPAPPPQNGKQKK